jgi:hypothetical protein
MKKLFVVVVFFLCVVSGAVAKEKRTLVVNHEKVGVAQQVCEMNKQLDKMSNKGNRQPHRLDQ